MSDTLDVSADETALATPFLATLVRLMRAEDSYGSWEKRSDAHLLKDFILTKEQRREIPIIGDPDPDVLWRIEKFYAAVGLAIEEKAGHIASPMMKMSHEGFGRVILTVGRLVVLSKSLRDVHRWGQENLTKLAEAGTKAVDEACEMIAKFPEVADW
ncbi:NifX-associated nitrogen fixation protein [Pinisolibacter aquiterrae]|uniref:NifX-associated nitrogen fixation protein n=1 Tax=Pinisolibacter aquiterrae TaxID=2815579 RepID=UPI001C3DB5E7|nr:NifX-associated nitrogen fixation protein [Pinisolibacter aquiterrae]MBV5266342.1 NifX-associated nitrogen fixation protein [Pinisolibacter aquiterrae]MCC8236489.1 NifX-associated nitrogen fixation protein [Pinisolibacter aquiterrae]